MTGLAASSSGYRPDLDGLRAIAVSSVLLFHLGVPGFQGGFTGVDIFFVLSGFFISKQIDADFKLGRFSLLSFYERRIRRIVPALIFILACCTAAALSFLFPSELTQYLKSLLAAAFSASNIYFFTQSSYFGATAETQVLLHTWSLGVEEQFYILFPVLVISALKTGSPMTKWFVWGVGLLSLGACITLSPAHQRAAFFLLPSRSWQLFSGAAIGLALVPRLSSQLVRECAGLIGAAAIGFSVWRINATLNYPGSYALLPTVGSALIIWSTMSGETLVSRLLQIQPMPFIGLISYSLYLWHWPLIVFSHLWSPGPFAVPQQVAIGVVALLLSIFSWRFVERPFRHHQGAWVSRSGVFTANGMSLVAVVLIAVSGSFVDGLVVFRKALFVWRQQLMTSVRSAPNATLKQKTRGHSTNHARLVMAPNPR